MRRFTNAFSLAAAALINALPLPVSGGGSALIAAGGTLGVTSLPRSRRSMDQAPPSSAATA